MDSSLYTAASKTFNYILLINCIFNLLCFVEHHEDVGQEVEEEENIDKENAYQEHLIDQDQVKSFIQLKHHHCMGLTSAKVILAES